MKLRLFIIHNNLVLKEIKISSHIKLLFIYQIKQLIL